jgi:hypothetical protein
MLIRTILATACLFALSGEPARASEQSAVIDRIQQAVDATNQRASVSVMASYFTASVVLIGGVSPFVFSGPAAQAIDAWRKVNAAEAEHAGVSQFSLQLLKPRRVTVDNARAYIVLPVDYRFERDNKQLNIPGVITATLEKSDGKWLISTWTWAGD